MRGPRRPLSGGRARPAPGAPAPAGRRAGRAWRVPPGAASGREIVVARRGPRSGTLRFGDLRAPCVLGRGGVARDKREGDGATPAGTHRVTGLLWRPDRMPRPCWPRGAARVIGPSDLWCDDPRHPLYNRPARAPLSASAERLRRADPLYDLVLTLDWNAEGAPGRGSAIFVHRWRRPGAPTEGCIALPPRALRLLARRIGPGTRLRVEP